MIEPTLDPDIRIIDPHHHLFGPPRDRGSASRPEPATYMLDELLADARSGHRIEATVIVSGHSFARESDTPEQGYLAETRVGAGVATLTASGRWGQIEVGAGLVGQADLLAGERVQDLLEAHIAAGAGRFRGIRHMTVWTDDPALAPPGPMAPPDLAEDRRFRAGFGRLAPLGLSFDAWCYFTQVPGITGLARAFPETTIVMNHCGGPLGSHSWEPRREPADRAWRAAVTELAACPNVFMKLGGLGMWSTGLPSVGAEPRAASEQIAREQRPYLEACLEAFGVDRCMFESNFPVEAGVGSYHTVWNAFKRVAATFSAAEKAALFRDVAARVYRLDGIGRPADA